MVTNNEKKLYLLVFLLFTSLVFSQSYDPSAENSIKKSEKLNKFRFGVFGGVNFADQEFSSLDSNVKKTMLLTFNGGLSVEYCINNNFSLESGIGITVKGLKVSTSATGSGITISAEAKANPLYLEVPLYGMYKIDIQNGKILLFAGPYIDYGVSGKYTKNFTAQNLPSGYSLSSLGLNDVNRNIKYGNTADSDYKNIDYGINAGLGLEIKSIQSRVKYGYGIANINPISNNIVVKNRVIEISLGYIF